MSKKLKNFRLSEEAIAQLELLAKKDDRSEAYIIEQLILATKKPNKKPYPPLPPFQSVAGGQPDCR